MTHFDSNSIYSNHLIRQIHDNLDLLLKLNQITPHNIDLIKRSLPNSQPSLQPTQSNQPTFPSHPTSPSTYPNLPHSHQNLPPQSQPEPHHLPPSFPTPPSTQSRDPPSQYKQARALWAYRGSATDDLTFQKGDIILILAEENQDWWRGQILNSSNPPGLFPSNHVELISSPPTQSNPVPPNPTLNQHNHSSVSYPNPPPPINSGYQNPGYGPAPNYSDSKNSHTLPPPPPLMHTQSAPPQPVNITVEKPKKNMLQGRFGQALAGGAGFGAGSAVATHVVNAIL